MRIMSERRIVMIAFQKDRLEVAHCAPVLVDTRNNEEEPRPFGAAAAKPDAI